MNNHLNRMNIILHFFVLLFLLQCKTEMKAVQREKTWEGGYNLEIIFSEDFAQNMEDDTLGFYRLVLDKVKRERSSIGLRSQKRIWKGTVSADRHLLEMERFELFREKNEYQRAKNLIQPKPSYLYFETRKNRLTQIFVDAGKNGTSYKFEIKFLPE